jgi:hypothetical protein
MPPVLSVHQVGASRGNRTSLGTPTSIQPKWLYVDKSDLRVDNAPDRPCLASPDASSHHLAHHGYHSNQATKPARPAHPTPPTVVGRPGPLASPSLSLLEGSIKEESMP